MGVNYQRLNIVKSDCRCVILHSDVVRGFRGGFFIDLDKWRQIYTLSPSLRHLNGNEGG